MTGRTNTAVVAAIRRWLPVVVAAILALGLVALGGRRLPGAGPGRAPVVIDFDLGQALTNFFLTGGALGALLALIGLFWPGREPLDLPRRSLGRYVVGPLIIIGAVGLVYLFPRSDAEPPVQAPTPTTIVDAPPPAPSGEPPVWGFYAFAGALGLALVLMARRSRGRGLPGDADAGGPAVSLESPWSADLPAGFVPGPDPRSQVIASYVEMVGVFAGRRLPRRVTETPREFIDRVVAATPVAARPAKRLTELFELARFSRHTLTPSDAEAAREAVAAVDAAVR